MEISKGMYIRFKNNKGIQYIGKLININEYREQCFKYAIEVTWYDDYIFIGDNDIIGEPSFDLIDLIKDGDYVNGYKVTYIDKDNQIIRVDGFGWGTNIIRKDNIKNIVTKEQFQNCKYVVERNK